MSRLDDFYGEEPKSTGDPAVDISVACYNCLGTNFLCTQNQKTFKVKCVCQECGTEVVVAMGFSLVGEK